MTPKWVLTLLTGLDPYDSRFYAEKRGGQEFRGWDPDRYATAATVDAVRALTWVYVAAHVKRKPKLPDPFPTPKAKTKKADKPGSFAHTAFSLLSAAKQRKELAP